MRRAWPYLVSGLLLLGAVWWVNSEPEPEGPRDAVTAGARAGGAPRGEAPSRARSLGDAEGGGAAQAEAKGRAENGKRERRARRDATLAKINAALRARADAEETAARARGEARRAAAAANDDAPAQVGDLNDRSGNRGYLLEVMNEELMPLIDECYELAKVDAPELEGMIALDVEVVGDEEIGGVVEAVAVSDQSELANAELVECARESLYATTLPPPPESGRDAFMLSLRVGPGDGAAEP